MTDTLAPFAALAFSVLAAGVIAFQAALAAGAPWGELTMGGKYPGRLPVPARLLALLSIVLLCGFAVILLARARLGSASHYTIAPAWSWAVVAYCAAGAVANAITP
ncbi:MAG TPA: hypothetical protein VIT92_02220, partial [Burkholderiaceae bacterium]